MDDYLNLNTELSCYQNHSKQSLLILQATHIYYKGLLKQWSNYIDGARKCNEDFNKELKKFEFEFDYIESLKGIVKTSDEHLNQIKLVLQKIDKDVAEAQLIFYKQYGVKYNDLINEFKSYNSSISSIKI